MSGANTYNPAEADLLEQATKDLSLAEYDDIWRVYVERGYDAASAVAKSYTSRFKARYKVIDTQPAIAESLKARAVARGMEAKRVAWLSDRLAGNPELLEQILSDATLEGWQPDNVTYNVQFRGPHGAIKEKAYTDVPRVKAYDPATDPMAIAFGADQAK